MKRIQVYRALLNLYIDQQISPEGCGIAGGGNSAKSATQPADLSTVFAGCIARARSCLIQVGRKTQRKPRRTGWWPSRRRNARIGGITLLAWPLSACVALGRGVVPLPVRAAMLRRRAAAVAAIIDGYAGSNRRQATRNQPAPHGHVPRCIFCPKTEDYLAQQPHFHPAGERDVGPYLFSRHLSGTTSGSPSRRRQRLRFRAPPRSSIEDFVFSQDAAAPENSKIFRPRQPGDESEENAIEFQR